MRARARPTAHDPGAVAQGPDTARFRLETRLASNPRTEVWRARQGSSVVALKIAARGAPVGPLEHEHATLRSLSHPHIVAVRDWIDAPGIKGFGLEYLSGGDLVSLAGSPPRHWLGAIQQVLGALAFLHGQGIVHRDVKARNVMLDAGGRARLIDFGSSAPIGSPWRAAGTTKEHRPEGWAGSRSSDGDDVYAFAALLFEMIRGRPAHATALVPQERACAGGGETLAELEDRVLDCLAATPDRCRGRLNDFALVIESWRSDMESR